MKTLIFAALTVLGLGFAVANAAGTATQANTQQGNQYNFMQGGGG